MFSSLLKKLKEHHAKKSVVTPQQEDAPIEETFSEEYDIISYVDKHGVIDKDAKSSSIELAEATIEGEELVVSPSQSSQKSTKKKVQLRTEEVDLSLFEEEEVSSNADEILAYIDTHGIEVKASDRTQKQVKESPFHRTKKAHELVIDLHGLRKEGARLRIKRAFNEAKSTGAGQILIIHGRGNHNTHRLSPLKQMVYELLEGEYASRVRSYSFAPPHEGGGGATRVILK